MAEPLSGPALDLFRRTPRAGHGGPGWARGAARDPLTGAELCWHWRVSDGTIAAAQYAVRGCPYLIAAAALAAERLEGQPAASPRLDLAALAGAIAAPVEKLGRLFVIEDAMQAAAASQRTARS